MRNEAQGRYERRKRELLFSRGPGSNIIQQIKRLFDLNEQMETCNKKNARMKKRKENRKKY